MARSVSFQKSRVLLSRMLSATALTAAGMMVLHSSAEAADNAWTQFEDVHGAITIDAQTPGQTKIDQHTQTYIGNSNNLDILQGQTVTIGQNNKGALFVGRSTRKGSDPTRILGNLNTRLKDANGNFTDAVGGTVMVLDRNGVVFGHNARIDVGGIIASTGDIANQDILNADGQYEFSDFGPGAIDIQGSITVSDAGLAAFVSPTISNSGVINAKMGKVVMASGEKVTLDLYGDELVEVAVSDDLSRALIENTGTINAQGGTVVVKAEAAKDIVDNIINMGGVVNAASAEVKGGKIVLGGGANGSVKVTGKLDASGKTGGGDIKVTGKNVRVTETAQVVADAQETGNGGRVDLIADNSMAFNGQLSARGGAAGGNGGKAEISGYGTLGFNGLVDLGADKGARGSLLLDPTFAVIHSGALPGGWLQDYVISAAKLALSLRNADITVQADNYIDVGTKQGGYANEHWTGNVILDGIITAGLNGLSDGAIDLSAWNFLGLTGATNGSLTLQSNTVNFNRDLTMGNGNLIVDGGNGGINWLADVTMAGGGDIDASTGGAHTFTNSVLTTTGDINLVAGTNIRQTDAVSGLVADRFSANAQSGAIDLQGQNEFNALDDVTADGDITLVDRTGGLTVDGTVSTQGGDIALSTKGNVHADILKLSGTGKILSNGGDIALHTNGAAGLVSGGSLVAQGLIDARGAGGAGDVTITTRQLQLNNGSAVYADKLTIDGALVNQGVNSKIEAAHLTGTLASHATLIGANNNIGALGDFTTGLHPSLNGDFTLHDVDGFDVTGAVVTKGGNIAVTTNSNSFDKAIDIKSAGSFQSNGGSIDLDNNGASGGFITVSGKIDAKGAAASAGDVTLNARQLRLQNGSKITAGQLATNGALVNQQAGSAITASKLVGTLTSQADFLGTANAIKEIGDFTTGTGSGAGGFTLVNGVDTTINGALLGGNGNIDLDITGNTIIAAGGIVNAEGGNIDINQSGTFSSGANTLKTSGTGTINIEQRAGGSINQAVQAFDNTGTGINTALVHNGTYHENVRITDSNVHLVSATGRVNTKIVGAEANGGSGTVEIASGVNNVILGGINKGFTIVGFDSAAPGLEKAAVYLAGAHDNIRVIHNEIEANGEGGLLTEYGFALNNIIIDSNTFSGKTFSGANPGIGEQFTVPNVPRALLFIGGANGGQNKTNITVSNNLFTGTVGGLTTGNVESGNTAVTVDAYTARITGNTFKPVVTGTATSLRARGKNTLISGNTFDNANLGPNAGHLVVSHSIYDGALVDGVQDDINAIYDTNTFIGNSTMTDNAGTGATSDYIGYKIQSAVNAAANGARIRVSDGTFNEAVNVNKSVTITGTGTTNTTIVDGSGLGANADGFTINANDISLNGMIVRNFGRAGINVQTGNRTNLSLDDIDASGNRYGLRTSTNAGIDGLTVTNSHFDNNEQGWVVQKGTDSSVFNNVTVTNTTFNNNSDKGLYAEKLSNAVFTDVTVNNSGTRAGYNANAGIDVNLKYGNYENITFNNVTVTGSGANGTGSGNAFTVKARDDGSYSANPASLSGLSINGGTVSGAGDTAIALGNNITDATVDGVTVSGANGIVVYGGVDKVTLSDNIMTLTGTSIGVADADDVSIVRNDIAGGTTGIALVNVTKGTVGGSAADANTIRDTADGWNNAGISIRNGGDLVVSHNDLTNVGGHSIRVDGTWGMAETPLTIASNTIKDAQFNAISLAHWNGATISGNDIDGVDVNHGIYLDLGRNTKVTGNDIRNVKGDGINLRRANIGTTIQSNTIDSVANGIVLGRIGSEINQQTLIGDMFGGPNGNTITNVGTGILADGAENTWIAGNKIDGASAVGIDVKDGTGYSIVNFNKIDDANHGIRMVATEAGVIASNRLGFDTKLTGHGITVQDSNETDILSNELKNIAQRGINIVRGTNIDVNDNVLEKIGQNGIRTDQVKGVNLNRNKLENIGWSGIELQGGTNAVVNRNTVKKAGGNGIQFSATSGVNVTNNTVNNARENGIIATGGSKVVASGNTVDTVGKDGLAIINTANAQILNNTIGLNGGANNIGTGAGGGDGIFVSNGNGAVIKGNKIANTKYSLSPAKGSGILVVKSSNTVIGGTAAGEGNQIDTAGSDGIVIRADGGVADNNAIIGNLIENVQRTGVYLSGATNTTVHRNVINNAGITLPDNGVITAINGAGVTLTRNDINGGAGHGIQLIGVGGDNLVRNNDVNGVGKDAITAQGVANLRIVNNGIGQNGAIGGHGVSVSGSNDARINDNTINNTAGNGILLSGGTNLTVRGNTIGLNAPAGNIGGHGIETNGVGDVRLVSNEIRRTVRDAILANGTGTARINRNIIRNVGGDGIEASGFADARINGNRIANAGEDGIEVHGNAKATLRNNRVAGSAVRGIYASGATNGDVILTGNRLVDNITGAEFQSGTIDLTGAANTIVGGDVGLRFDPTSAGAAANLLLAGATVDYTGGSIGGTIFEGLSDPGDQFIVLDNGAFFDPGQPSLIDARYARFNGVSASDDATGRFRLYQAQLDAIEERIFHFKDVPTLGQFFYGNLNSVPVIIDITSVDQEDTLQYFTPVTFQPAGLSITINGMPSVTAGGTAQAFNNITPFAGGAANPAALNDITPAAGDDTSPASLNAIETASGSAQASCWADASGLAQGGQVVSISYGATAEDALSSAASCSAGI